MNRRSNESPTSLPVNWILLAGLVGGLAEVLWVAIYAAGTPLQAWTVAREIAVSVFGGSVGSTLAPALGLLIHFVLSIAIASAFAATLWVPLMRRYGRPGVTAGSVAMLTTIWVVNFLVLLPAVNPAFVVLMPMSVTLTSKILFGLGVGICLAMAPRRLGPTRNPVRNPHVAISS